MQIVQEKASIKSWITLENKEVMFHRYWGVHQQSVSVYLMLEFLFWYAVARIWRLIAFRYLFLQRNLIMTQTLSIACVEQMVIFKYLLSCNIEALNWQQYFFLSAVYLHV